MPSTLNGFPILNSDAVSCQEGASCLALTTKARFPERIKDLKEATIIGPVWAINLDDTPVHSMILEIAVHCDNCTALSIGEGCYPWIFGILPHSLPGKNR